MTNSQVRYFYNKETNAVYMIVNNLRITMYYRICSRECSTTILEIKMKFISNKNTYEFDAISFKDNLIALYIEDQYVVLEWQGNVDFFKDGNGVGESWIDFSHDITTELVHELSDENITLLDINEDYVVEWIAEQIYLAMEKDCENF